MQRSLADASLDRSVALPAAAGNANTASIDLGSFTDLDLEKIEVEVATDDLPAAFASAATLTFTLQDSADDTSFSAISSLATVVHTGTGAALAGLRRRIKLQPNGGTRRYIRANVALSSGGGAITAYKAYLRLRF